MSKCYHLLKFPSNSPLPMCMSSICFDIIFDDEKADEQYGQKLVSSCFLYEFVFKKFIHYNGENHIN